MRWRTRPLGCLVAVAIFAVMGVAIVGMVVWGSVIGNRDGPLVATGFQPGSGLQDAPDRRSGGSIETVPTWIVNGEVPVGFTVTLRNTGDAAVRVTGVRRDPDGDDQQFAPERSEPVTLQPGQSAPVEVEGRSVCGNSGGQVSGKNGQTFTYDDGETQNVDFEAEALIEFVACR